MLLTYAPHLSPAVPPMLIDMIIAHNVESSRCMDIDYHCLVHDGRYSVSDLFNS